MRLFSGEPTAIRLLAISPQGNWVAAQGATSPQRWSVATPKIAMRLFAGNTKVHHLSSTADDGLRTLGTDGTGCVWSPATNWSAQVARTLFANQPEQSALSADGEWAAFVRAGGVRVGAVGGLRAHWDGMLNPTVINNDRFLRVAFSTTAHTVVARSQFGHLRRWRVDDGQALLPLRDTQHGPDLGLQLSADGARAGVLGHNGIMLCSEQHANWLPDSPTGDWPKAFAFAPHGTVLAVGRQSGIVEFWDLPPADEPIPEALQPRLRLDWRLGTVTSLLYAADGMTLAVGGSKGQVCLWDVE